MAVWHKKPCPPCPRCGQTLGRLHTNNYYCGRCGLELTWIPQRQVWRLFAVSPVGDRVRLGETSDSLVLGRRRS